MAADRRRIRIAIAGAIPWATVLRLDRECFPDKDEPPVDQQLATVWVATYGRRVVGYSVVNVFTDTTLFVSRQGVAKRWRGLGIQRRMLAAICRHAARRGLEVVSYTSPGNCPSSNNFIATGFETYSVAGYSDQGWVCWRRKP